ncbi:triphosphoribosyl-dephospho-CoA synthase [Klebsiella huaxiensis]|uniref:Probable 2-(5''-triphosphoribosyl)-3'-dephosphocoenzyme-A synthase n=1 Tax=Klebsiella huaxiensis TaxID=2153354 RepID=A0A564I7P8_9ENTR|nr:MULTISPECIES: triphosphoribosyl-dephospho-CoA synthase [Klebsiella]MDG1645534.1 triphosphoribosyl-dephospho-CoA synthase [Klebsiella huaxiensis]QBG06286.1 triphosphoribosyl-dephospho-CoA synthase [Klebsiella huaxiensis]VUS41472.1 2-(5''-triphosphoribosyl)-3'-dephosphocoenzyme-A synthase [Klebsiella huaxiensis]VUT22431.1 2-(5''-triphosphoribosyl)-3'-dephosphocoenzyme-A synthase [Klebsiella huaxiensis]
MSQPTVNAIRIGECLLKALLMEVCAWPKPGLVTPHSQGAHNDMDIWLFITSTSAIAPCFQACAQAGEYHQGSLADLFPKVRLIGIQYEATLLQSTRQVNTQRGILFAGAILAAAAGWLKGQNQSLTRESLSQCVAGLCLDLCRNDFAALTHRSAQTHGEKLYLEFGVTGVRGEAEQGFPLVCHIGLPALHQALSLGFGWREALIHTLLALMARCDDTTVISRAGHHTLDEMKQRAQRLVNMGGMSHPGIEHELNEFNAWCLDKWVSPGGSADLLALSLAMYFLCHQSYEDPTREGI